MITRLGLIMTLFFMTATGLVAGEHTKDSLKTVKKNLKAGKAVLLDVREKREWDAGHLKDAQLVPLSAISGDAAAASKKLPKKKIVYTHCRSGHRSVIAAAALKKLGFDVRALKAGYTDLVKAGFPKAKSDQDK